VSVKKAVLIAMGNDYVNSELIPLLAPPLGVLALGSYLAEYDVPVELIDVQVDFGFGLTDQAQHEVFRRVAQYLSERVDDIAWIGVSQFFNNASGVTLAEEIRALLPEAPILFGGHFPSCHYRFLLEDYPFITAIICGDGEVAALQISQAIAQGKPFLCDETPNLAWRDGAEIHTTPIQPVPPEGLPNLDFRLLNNPDSYQLVALTNSRGCPFHCVHCIGDTLRPYSGYAPEWMSMQLNHLETELTNKQLFFYGPTFGLGRERMLEICRVMKKRRFVYGAESRVDVLQPDLIPDLCNAGLQVLLLEMGSASPETLVRMKRARSMAAAERYINGARDLLAACFENGVVVVLSAILPYPGDSEDDFQATLEFVKEMSHLQGQIAGQSGVTSGFLPYALPAEVYDNTPLAEQLDTEFSDATLSESFFGERWVLSPSEGVDLDAIRGYQFEIRGYGTYEAEIIALAKQYIAYPKDELVGFLATQPGLTDEQGVTVLGASARDLLP